MNLRFIKNAITVVIICIVIFAFIGCGCKHDWKKATCTEPKTCSLCGETEGVPLGHEWANATCVSPRTCTRCGKKDGVALGHEWQKATCTESRTCNRCGEIDGEALGHDWKEATCMEPKTCARCGKVDGEALGHDWKEATYTNPKTCTRCGATEGKTKEKDTEYCIQQLTQMTEDSRNKSKSDYIFYDQYEISYDDQRACFVIAFSNKWMSDAIVKNRDKATWNAGTKVIEKNYKDIRTLLKQWDRDDGLLIMFTDYNDKDRVLFAIYNDIIIYNVADN